MKHCLHIIIFSLFFSSTALHAQDRTFKVLGAVYEGMDPLEGASVRLYYAEKSIEQVITSGRAQFHFVLEADKKYSVRISKEGYLTKRIDFDTKAPDDALLNLTSEFEVTLIRQCDGVDASILDTPVDVIQYSKSRQALVSDEVHYQNMRSRIQQLEMDVQKCLNEKFSALLSEVDQLMSDNKLEEAEDKIEEALDIYPQDRSAKKKQAALERAMQNEIEDEILYNKLIYAGDAALATGNLELAQQKYEQAKSINPKGEELDAKFMKLQEEIESHTKKMEIDKQYDSYLTYASKAELNKNYPLAKDYYDKAIGLKPGDEYATKKATQMQPLIQEYEKQKELDKQRALAYEDAITQGNTAMQRNDYVAAKAAFEKAKSIDPSRPEPSSKLSDAILKIQEQKRAELAEQKAEKERQFNSALQEGDQLLKENKFNEALAAYQRANALYPNNPEPIRLINKTKNEIIEADERKSAEVNTAYDEAFAEAERLKLAKKYEEAKVAYQKALSIKPNQKDALSRISETNKLIEDKKKAQQKLIDLRNQYNNLISEADALYKSEQYNESKTIYQQASALISSEMYPRNQIASIDNILAKLAIEKQFNTLIAQADNQIEAKSYSTAIATLQKAKVVKPESTLPEKKINDIKDLQNRLEQQEVDARFEALITEGDKLRDSKQFGLAIAKYESAKTVKPESDIPDAKINSVKDIENQLAQEEVDIKFSNLISTGDQLKDKKQFDVAIAKYETAKRLKPESTVPDIKINEVKALQNSIAKQEVDANYNAALAEADNYLDKGSYDLAVASYRKAAAIKPEEVYPQGQINKISQIKSNRMLQKIKDRYTAIIVEADQAFSEQGYDKAIVLYNSALDVLPEETYPRKRINEINGIYLKQKQEKERAIELENKYNSIIQLADKYFNEANYPLARAEYSNALALKSSATYPAGQIDKINEREAQIRLQKQEKAALEKEYKLAVLEADNSFKAKNYTMAKQRYNDALKLKPAEIHPKEQIKRIGQILLAKEAREKELADKENQYNAFIAKADEYYKSYNYKEAKEVYLNAMQLKPSEMYPQAMLRKIEDALKLMASANKSDNSLKPRTETPKTSNPSTESKNTTNISTELGELNFKNSSERQKYYELLKDKYPVGITKEIHTGKTKTTTRYIIIRGSEVSEIRKITFSWGGVQYSRNGKPITGNYFKTLIKPHAGEKVTENVIEN